MWLTSIERVYVVSYYFSLLSFSLSLSLSMSHTSAERDEGRNSLVKCNTRWPCASHRPSGEMSRTIASNTRRRRRRWKRFSYSTRSLSLLWEPLWYIARARKSRLAGEVMNGPSGKREKGRGEEERWSCDLVVPVTLMVRGEEWEERGKSINSCSYRIDWCCFCVVLPSKSTCICVWTN